MEWQESSKMGMDIGEQRVVDHIGRDKQVAPSQLLLHNYFYSAILQSNEPARVICSTATLTIVP